ncbi:MAG: hypothetical protein ISQ06_13825 [Planctomycetaceae bacterium]|nr:hypothetical protein [Planctomycetaceae bacterium]
MKRSFVFGGVVASGLVLATVLIGPGSSSELFGQGKKPAIKPPSVAAMRALELREKKAREQFLRDTAQLAKDYEEAGLLEKAKDLLKTVQRVDSSIAGVKEKLDTIEETILSANPYEFSIDSAKGWGEPVARVEQGKKFRVAAKGSYKFVVQETVGPTGFPSDDPLRQMTKGIPSGALMAIVIPLNDRGKPGKPGQPIEIGDGKEITPKESGLLLIGVNAPAGNKNQGNIDIQLSGYLAPPK